MSQRHKKKKNRAPINFDEFKVDPIEDDEEEEEEVREESDCCDKCLFALFGFLLIYIGIFVIFFSERDYKYSRNDIQYITNNLQSMNIDKTTSFDDFITNNHPIHFISSISKKNEKNMIVMDDRTDISYPGIALQINTEMFQWIEKQEQVRKDGTTTTEIKYSYHKGWSNTFHDSSNFKEQDDHYNPQPTVSQLSRRMVWVDDIVIGSNDIAQLHLAKSLYAQLIERDPKTNKFKKWQNVTKKAFVYSELEGWEIRDGFCFRPYDKAESYYAEPEMDDDDEENAEEQNDDENADTDNDNDNEYDDDDDVEESHERVKLDKPRTIIGDIRMTIFSLDTRGRRLSFVGAVKKIKDDDNDDDEDNKETDYKLVSWKSASNHQYVMLEYGAINSEDSLKRFSTENALKLWLSRLLTFILMFVGFMVLHQNVLNSLIVALKLPIKEKPLKTWLMTIVSALMVSAILYVTVLLIAYLIGIIYIALTLIVGIVLFIFLNNKSPKTDDVDSDGQKKQLKDKKEK